MKSYILQLKKVGVVERHHLIAMVHYQEVTDSGAEMKTGAVPVSFVQRESSGLLWALQTSISLLDDCMFMTAFGSQTTMTCPDALR